MTAVISECGQYRYRLDRDVQERGIIIAYFGVNPSTADASIDDQTIRKWRGFAKLNGARKIIVGNPFAFRSTDVKNLANCRAPVGPENSFYLDQIIIEADLLVPCWGNRKKVPQRLHGYFELLEARLFASGKHVQIFGLTKAGDPKHPLMLGYKTQLTNWHRSR